MARYAAERYPKPMPANKPAAAGETRAHRRQARSWLSPSKAMEQGKANALRTLRGDNSPGREVISTSHGEILLSAINLKAYFERIGFAGSIAPTLATLEALHGLHPQTIAFENLDPVMGLPVALDQASLGQKMLQNRRGGFCFEHNTLFKAILEDLDYSVRAYAARVLWGHPEGAERPLSHMVLAVDIGGATYLCDVGFGSFTLTSPLRLRADVEQATPNETFRLIAAGEGFRLEVRIEGEWTPVYQFDLAEQSADELKRLSDLVSADHNEQRLLTASLAGTGKRINLRRNRLTIHRADAERERRTFQTIGEIKDTLTNIFGIVLPSSELLDPALVRVIEAAHAEEEAAESQTGEAEHGAG